MWPAARAEAYHGEFFDIVCECGTAIIRFRVNRRSSTLSLTTVLFFIAAMITLGFADFATKQTSGRISPALGTWIYAATAMVPALLWTLWTRAHAPLLVTRAGIQWSVLTGLAFGVFAGILF